MKKAIIKFKIKSLDSTVSFTVNGEFDKNNIRFTDNNLSDHSVVLKDNTVEYYKKGLTDMKFVFDIMNTTKGTYVVDNNTFVFTIVTTKLENTSNRLIVEYNLIQDNEVVNESLLDIKYSIAKEE